MKMGTTASPWRSDAMADCALQPINLRWPAISLRLIGRSLPSFAGWSSYPSIAALLINPGIVVMGQEGTSRLASCGYRG